MTRVLSHVIEELYEAENRMQVEEGVRFLREDLPGRLVPRSEYPSSSLPGMSGSRSSYATVIPVERFGDGANPPYFETEFDLAVTRTVARSLSLITSTHIGALEALVNYTIGEGFQYEVAEKKDYKGTNSERALKRAQAIIEDFIEANSFCNDGDREWHNRNIEHGEAFLKLSPRRGRTYIEFLEPEMITEPTQNLHKLEEIAGTTSMNNYWRFGVHTVKPPNRRREDMTPLGYHVAYTGSGDEWEYVHADALIHTKRNVSRNVKRGLSDFYPVYGDIENEAKLRRNSGESAAILAAIVGIRQHAENTTRDQILDFQKRQRDTQRERSSDTSGNQVRNVGFIDRPHIRDIKNGMQWMSGPLGTLNHPIFIEVRQMLLRSLGMRWTMPEYMISGDASNGNFSSTLVAESPFVKARQANQATWTNIHTDLMWRVLYIAWRSGLLPEIVNWGNFMATVEVIVTPPDIITRDPQQETQRNQILNDSRVMSKKTWRTREGLDNDEEEAALAEEPNPMADLNAVTSDFSAGFNDA